MKPRLPPVSPDARTVVPGREVTYHNVPQRPAPTKISPTKIAPMKIAAKRDRGSPAHDMRLIVVNVLVGVRERWEKLSTHDKQKIVTHLRSVADLIENSIGGEAP